MDVLTSFINALGSDTTHLPLKEGMSLHQVLGMVNIMYLSDTPLTESDYKETQAFLASDGLVKFELIGVNSEDVLFTFVNVMGDLKKAQTTENPFHTLGVVAEFMFTPLQVNIKEELEFLEALPVGIQTAIVNPANDVNYRLATLLNNYNYNGRWMAGTFGLLSTAGFEVVYRGPSEEAPRGFLLDYAPYVVIVRLHQGEQRGLICLRT